MKHPWGGTPDMLNTDLILTRMRERNIQDPIYSAVKQIVEEVCGPSEYTETRRVDGSKALGKPIKKTARTNLLN